MTAPLTLPQARIPLGWVMVGGQRAPVEIDREWMLAFLGLLTRTGGITGNTSAGSALDELLPLLMEPVRDAQTQEAMRAIEELRQELAGARSETHALRGQLEDALAQMAGMRQSDDLRGRIEQIEDRLS